MHEQNAGTMRHCDRIGLGESSCLGRQQRGGAALAKDISPQWIYYRSRQPTSQVFCRARDAADMIYVVLDEPGALMEECALVKIPF